MEQGAHQPGDRQWGYWRYDLGIEEPATRLERVLALEERGLLTEEERRKIVSEGETPATAASSRTPTSSPRRRRRRRTRCAGGSGARTKR